MVVYPIQNCLFISCEDWRYFSSAFLVVLLISFCSAFHLFSMVRAVRNFACARPFHIAARPAARSVGRQQCPAPSSLLSYIKTHFKKDKNQINLECTQHITYTTIAPTITATNIHNMAKQEQHEQNRKHTTAYVRACVCVCSIHEVYGVFQRVSRYMRLYSSNLKQLFKQ